MDKNLYEQAKNNVLQCRKQVEKQELRNEIEAEAGRLKYKKEILQVTADVQEELEVLQNKMDSKPVSGVWDNYAKWGFFNMYRDIKKTGKYHPNQLKLMRSHTLRP